MEEDDTMEGGAGMQSLLRHLHAHRLQFTGPHGQAVSRMPSHRHALASGVHVSSEHRGAHIAIERVAALAGLAVGGTHEHDLALVVDGGGAHDVETR